MDTNFDQEVIETRELMDRLPAEARDLLRRLFRAEEAVTVADRAMGTASNTRAADEERHPAALAQAELDHAAALAAALVAADAAKAQAIADSEAISDGAKLAMFTAKTLWDVSTADLAAAKAAVADYGARAKAGKTEAAAAE